MASKFIVSCLLISSCSAAPQTLFARQAAAIGSHDSQTVRSPFGTVHTHSKTVTDLDGTAHVHKFDSRVQNNAAVVRVARPRLLSSGPFAVQALPSQTPVFVGGAGATPVITAARNNINGAGNLFQTPDGRIFAFSNGNQQILPGQIFQTPDGRIFTTSVINQNAQAEDTSNDASIVQASRNVAQAAEEEEEEEVIENDPEPENNNNQRSEQQQQQQRQQQDVVVTQGANGLPSFVAVPSTQIVARAPFTPATQRFVAAPAQAHSVVSHDAVHHVVPATTTQFLRANPVLAPATQRFVAAPAQAHSHSVVSHDAVHHVVPTATTQFVRANPVLAPATQVVRTNPVLAQANPILTPASTGFFTFPGAGIAFQF